MAGKGLYRRYGGDTGMDSNFWKRQSAKQIRRSDEEAEPFESRVRPTGKTRKAKSGKPWAIFERLKPGVEPRHGMWRPGGRRVIKRDNGDWHLHGKYARLRDAENALARIRSGGGYAGYFSDRYEYDIFYRELMEDGPVDRG